jgi:hypothetical protein
MISVVSFVPAGLTLVVAVVAAFSVIVLYALYKKGDVHVHLSRGKTGFELDAKERTLR